MAKQRFIMKMRFRRLHTMILVMSFGMAGVYSQDWPQYLGPDRNSVSPQQNVIRSWQGGKPEIEWSVNVGIGFGGAVTMDGMAYLLDRNDETGDMMRCFDLDTGNELWNYSYEAPGSVSYPGSRSVPALDGNRIYSCGPYGDLYCININTHQPVWNRNIWKDFGGVRIPNWAITQCPLVYGDIIIVASQAPQAGVVAYDKLTGEVKWKTPSLGPVGYVSPAIVKVGGEDHVVMITAAQGRGSSASGGKVVGIDPLVGKILWEYGKWQCRIPVPGAFDAGDSRVLIVGGYEAGTVMLRIEKNGSSGYDVKELFRTIEFGAHTKPPVLYDGYLYAQYSTNERRDGLVCMSLDGEIMWKTRRSPEFTRGSMIVADGLIIASDGMNGLYLIQPDPERFNPVAMAELLAEESSGDETEARIVNQNWGPMALSNGRLLFRDQQRLFCVKIAE